MGDTAPDKAEGDSQVGQQSAVSGGALRADQVATTEVANPGVEGEGVVSD